MARHTIVRCSCGALLEPCDCGELADSAHDPHEVDVREAACPRCATGIRPIVKTKPLERFGAIHAHDLDNSADLEPK